MLASLRTTIALACALPTAVTLGQSNIGKGKAAELYTQYCVTCHGEQLDGGLGKSLIDTTAWSVVGKSRSFLDYVQKGDPKTGMPPFAAALDQQQIRSLEIFIQEKRQLAQQQVQPTPQANGIVTTPDARFRLETIVDDLDHPWSLEFLPDGSLLISERSGSLHHFANGVLSAPIPGIPQARVKGQGGLLDISIHPDYERNGWIYLSYSEQSSKDKGLTAIARGRLRDGQWVDNETIFSCDPKFHSGANVHWGTRLVFKDDKLFFGIGDRGEMHRAQDLAYPNGKIHRIHPDGSIPTDNPFVDAADALPSIWALGVRNPQGMVLSPDGTQLWESEHGPRGGDEINLIERGKNYGWPKITYGMNYNGTPITDQTSAPGMEQPVHYWTPSIAVCGIDFYTGNAFPEWKGDLFAGGLKSQELHRLHIENSTITQREIVLKDAGRIRDVRSSPSGELYLVLNNPSRIVRLAPAD